MIKLKHNIYSVFSQNNYNKNKKISLAWYPMVNRMPHIYSIFSQTIYKSNKLYFPKARTMQSRVVKILVTYILRSVYVHGSRVHNLRIRYTTAVTGDDGWVMRNEVMRMRRPSLTMCTLVKRVCTRQHVYLG